MYKLIGTHLSPYVRRIRLAMENIDYEFIPIDFSINEDYQSLLTRSPIGKVPLLIRDDFTLYDSRVIYRYLDEKYLKENINWQQENHLTLIDELNDTLLNLLLLKRSEYDLDDTRFYLTNLYRRLSDGFQYLEDNIEDFNEWNFVSISLLCLIEWCQFRELWDLSPYENLLNFTKRLESLDIVQKTSPFNL